MRQSGLRRLARMPLAALAGLAALTLSAAAPAAAASRPVALTVYAGQPAGPPLLGLGVQFDPYDSFTPSAADWKRSFARLDFMRPGFLRVVESAFDYFGGYNRAHLPIYRWNSPHLRQLRRILGYAQSRGIKVVLGDWGDPLINGDAQVPAGFLAALHDRFGFSNITYYNLINEPNYVDGCDFGCWTGMAATLSAEFNRRGIGRWLQLVGPDNANSWDDTAKAQALDLRSGLDSDNPLGGDSWVTATLQNIPGLIGAYDSHRYGTIWGVEHGVYEDQMRARREQISNLDRPGKPYFAGELGLTARQVTPFSALDHAFTARAMAPLIDPSARAAASPFVDSQPHITQFAYGVWMGDMMIQGLDGGMAGASAWDLDDAMHVGGQYGTQNLKRWGFWNSLGGRDGYAAADLRPRPWYYAWSILARGFPAGATALTVPATRIAGLRVLAAEIPRPGGYDVSLAAVNDADAPRTIQVSVPAAVTPVTLTRYDYFAAHRPTDPAGLPVPAHVRPNASLAAGVTLRLPARGLVLLTSIGSSPALSSGAASSPLVDELDDFHRAASHGGGLKLDHGSADHFDGDRSRVAARRAGRKELVYVVPQATSFTVKAYYHARLGLHAYASPDGRRWTAVRLASTPPAPAIGGGGWYLRQILPNTPLPVATRWVKFTLTNQSTELSQVRIASR